MEQKTNETSNTAVTTQVTTIGDLQFKSFVEMKAWGDEVVKSGMTPLKTGGAVIAAVMMGKELGLEAMVSVNNIIPINGKATLGIHLINSLLLRAGIVTEVLRDYEPCVAFAMKGDDGKPYLDEGKPIILRYGFADEEPKSHEVKAKKIVDYKTTIKMTRSLRQEDGTFKTMSVTESFSYNDALQADLMKKDNWAKYTRKMVSQRLTAFVGRAIADDILLGMYETSEMADASHVPYHMSEEGKITIIETNATETKSNEHVEEAQVVVEQSETSNTTTTTEEESK